MIRPLDLYERRYVCSVFAEQFSGSPYAEPMSREQLRQLMGKLLRTNWIGWVYCLPEAPDEILAWCVCRGNDVAWLTVCKTPARGRQISKQLLQSCVDVRREIRAPFLLGNTLSRTKHWLNVRYRPMLLLEDT